MHPQTVISRKSKITKITISKGFSTIQKSNLLLNKGWVIWSNQSYESEKTDQSHVGKVLTRV